MSKIDFEKRTEYGTVQKVVMHSAAREVISKFPENVKFELGYLIYKLQLGESFGPPRSKPLRAVTMGAHELRVRGEDGIYRAFYYTKSRLGILVFHAFIKKTQQVPDYEIELGKKRLNELLEE